MAKPRIFISSTFYDLQQIRVELDKFIESLGYEAIRNEEGDSGYNEKIDLETKEESLSKTLDDAKEDTSTHNRSSIIFIFEPIQGKKYLFTGDASIESFTRMYKSSFDYIQNVQWLKLPHHGS